ncbi:hypothetical protein [Novosphingobium sp. Gsoil 351]|uniref:hypothetical protein n=1 Tax=Novosphingobium sp. Gsoil 351 TaxID=2675225 RepID=UPI001E29A10C|nr:hypothetical protein [Novosphingobium sp. Gsoil 351]
MLSIPALILQPAPMSATAQANHAADSGVFTATAEPLKSQAEEAPVSRARQVDTRIAIVPRLAPIASERTSTSRHSYVGQSGDLRWSFDTERFYPQTFHWLSADRLTQHRGIAANAELGIDLARDRLSALANATLEKRPNAIVASNRNFESSRTLGAGIGWSHAGQWRLDIAMQSTTTQAKSPMARLAALADGSARAERQVSSQLTLAPVAFGSRAAATFGIRASMGRLTGSDRTLFPAGNGWDKGVFLITRLAF